MWTWGDQMRHCIASYCEDLMTGRGWYGGVYSIDPGTGDEVLDGNFEIRLAYNHQAPAEQHDPETGEPPVTATLTQLLGQFNKRLPTPVVERVTAHLAEHDVIVSQFWGDARPLPA